jgi:hypothetical protein
MNLCVCLPPCNLFTFWLNYFLPRGMTGQSSSPAQHPNCNRYCESLCRKLCEDITGKSRWARVLHEWSLIRQCVLRNGLIQQKTQIQIPQLNEHTLKNWYDFCTLMTCVFSPFRPSKAWIKTKILYLKGTSSKLVIPGNSTVH